MSVHKPERVCPKCGRTSTSSDVYSLHRDLKNKYALLLPDDQYCFHCGSKLVKNERFHPQPQEATIIHHQVKCLKCGHIEEFVDEEMFHYENYCPQCGVKFNEDNLQIKEVSHTIMNMTWGF